MVFLQSVGERLRQARVQKGLQVSDVSFLTAIDSHVILILELDQFQLLSDEECHDYLERLATVTGLDGERLVEQYERQKEPQANQVTEESFDDYNVKESNVLISKTRSRYRKKQGQCLVWLRLTLVLLIPLLLWSGYQCWLHRSTMMRWDNKPVVETNSTSDVKEIPKPPVTTPNSPPEASAASPKTQITIEDSGDYLVARVKTSTFPVKVTFTLKEAPESWVALTNSELGEIGILLQQQGIASYETELLESSLEAWMTLGVVDGLSIMINDAKLDLSPFETASPTYVNLIIDKSDTTNE